MEKISTIARIQTNEAEMGKMERVSEAYFCLIFDGELAESKLGAANYGMYMHAYIYF